MNIGRNMKALKLVGALAFSVLAVAALNGCTKCATSKNCSTEYKHQPPASHAGQMCVKKCEKAKLECQDERMLQYRNCEHHNRMVRLEFERCSASGATNCYHPSAPPCEKPCGNSGTCGDQCETNYRHCYQTCGGTIVSKESCESTCK